MLYSRSILTQPLNDSFIVLYFNLGPWPSPKKQPFEKDHCICFTNIAVDIVLYCVKAP